MTSIEVSSREAADLAERQRQALDRARAGSRRDRTDVVRAAGVVSIVGYAILVAALLAVGLLVTHALDGTVGRWDEHVNQWFVGHRTSGWNAVTKIATMALNTGPVVGAVVVVLIGLLIARWWRGAALLAIAMVLEISVFLSTTFVIGRDRPAVPRLNASPSTSSFPSGHTAAATVFFMTVALLVSCRTGNRMIRALVWTTASLLVAIVAFARVYRGLHHPTDVFAGFLYGLGCILVAVLAVRAGTREADGSRSTGEREADDGGAMRLVTPRGAPSCIESGAVTSASSQPKIAGSNPARATM